MGLGGAFDLFVVVLVVQHGRALAAERRKHAFYRPCAAVRNNDARPGLPGGRANSGRALKAGAQAAEQVFKRL
ncbi:hypothetical protein GCM10025771_20130 [Niveibacterium umoris]